MSEKMKQDSINNIEELRKQFPELSERVYGKPLVYLDNAATSLRPLSVVDEWTQMSTKCNANLHRAVHHLADIATKKYEDTRAFVARSIGAASASEIIFTSGTTDSVNLLAFSFGEAMVKSGDEILVGEAEHHSDIVPWQMMCQRKGAILKRIPVDDKGQLELEALKKLLSPRTKLVCVAHISNVLGIVNPISKIASIVHSSGALMLVDGAQGIVHCNVNVQELGADFYAFSGHKVYAAPGTGVLYGRRELLDQLPPYRGGGEMIQSVSWEHTSYAEVPQRFEAGTQNISGTPTLVPALELAGAMNNSSVIKEEESLIRDYVLKEFADRPHIHLFGRPDNISEKVNLYSFTVNGAHHEDLALILDKMGVAVRSGQMCAEPLMDRFGVTGMVRASFSPFNTLEEARYFISSLDRAISMLK